MVSEAGVLTNRQAERSVATRVRVTALGWFGVEHEFQVVDDDGNRVAFGPLMSHRGESVGRRLDPADANARRTRWGGVVTVDGDEAEMATNQLPLQPGWTVGLLRACALGAEDLRRLSAPYRLRGYSTHLNVSVDGSRRRVDEVARLAMDCAGPALALMLDHADSPGLLVRPRAGRVEVCGEYVAGDALAAASLFAVAVVRGADDARVAERLTTRRVVQRLERSRQRFGWVLPRDGAVADLYLAGRGAVVCCADGRHLSGQQLLEQTWRDVRPMLHGLANDEELALVDRVVEGHDALPCERPPSLHPLPHIGRPIVADVSARRVHGPLTVECLAATWRAAVFSLSTTEGSSLLTIPARSVDRFVHLLDGHELDHELRVLAHEPVRARASVRTDQLSSQSRVDPRGLVPSERDHLGRTPPRGPGARREKHRSDDQAPRSAPRTGRPKWLISAVVAGALVIGTGAALVMARGGDSASAPDPSGTTSVGAAGGTTATASTEATSSTVLKSLTIAGSATFTAYISGLDLDARAKQDYLGIKTAQGLYPPPVGVVNGMTGNALGPCDGIGECSFYFQFQGPALGAYSPYTFIPTDPVQPSGGRYQATASMLWSEAAALSKTDPCRLGDPTYSRTIDLQIVDGRITGTIDLQTTPQLIPSTPALGGCFGDNFVLTVDGTVG